jgi:hypothetical protein
MKKLLFIIFCLLAVRSAGAQPFRSAADLWTVYSENGEYYLKSIPWDNEEPSLRGTTSVYRKAGGGPVYILKRGFDAAGDNKLTLSNTGEIIFYVIEGGKDEKRDGLKSITIYKKGEIIASYTESEITGCDYKKERCSLLYKNWESITEEKSWGTGKIVFKPGVSAEERFLYDYMLFSTGDIVYLTDSKKKVHRFDLQTGKHLGYSDFESSFEQLRKIARPTRAAAETFDAPTYLDYPKLRSGKDTNRALAEKLGMKLYDMYDTKREFKLHGFKLTSYLRKDGSVEIENLEWFGDLPKEKIIEFFTTNRFVTAEIPVVSEKWFIEQEFYFRNADDKLARQERQADLELENEALKKRLVSETIDGRYIPKDLGECFVELDKILNDVDRKEMSALKDRNEMIRYHLGLGMWLRNNWGLWGGSRLRKYFTERGVTHPDNMSVVILDHYYDWLHGEKETWKEWEKTAKRPN